MRIHFVIGTGILNRQLGSGEAGGCQAVRSEISGENRLLGADLVIDLRQTDMLVLVGYFRKCGVAANVARYYGEVTGEGEGLRTDQRRRKYVVHIGGR